MKYLFRLVMIFALAIGLAVVASQDTSTLAFRMGGNIIELNRNLAFVLLLVTLFVFYFGVRLLRSIQHLPTRVARYRKEKARAASDSSLRDAMKAYFEGRYVQAEKAAQASQKGDRNQDNLGTASLIGARAAQALGQAERREMWLANLKQKPGYELAGAMAALELAVERHDYDTALNQIAGMNASGRRHVQAMRLALQANRQARHWHEVLRLVRQLDKHGALEPTVAAKMRASAYAAMFDRATDLQSVTQIWRQVAGDEKTETLIASHAAQAFLAVDAAEQARQVVENSLARIWDSQLLFAYRRAAAETGSPALLAQIERCEKWLNRNPGDSELCLTLGTLCLRQQLWGKAQRHLESALRDDARIDIRRQAHLTLARLHTMLDKPDLAAEQYRLSAEAGAS